MEPSRFCSSARLDSCTHHWRAPASNRLTLLLSRNKCLRSRTSWKSWKSCTVTLPIRLPLQSSFCSLAGSLRGRACSWFWDTSRVVRLARSCTPSMEEMQFPDRYRWERFSKCFRSQNLTTLSGFLSTFKDNKDFGRLTGILVSKLPLKLRDSKACRALKKLPGTRCSLLFSRLRCFRWESARDPAMDSYVVAVHSQALQADEWGQRTGRQGADQVVLQLEHSQSLQTFEVWPTQGTDCILV